jgi:hypothetical protein
MSYLNGSVETQYLDPVSFVPNGRCRFELDGDKMAYKSNMRLLDIGVVSNGNHNYSRGLGSLACIKSMRLLDGRSELSAIRNPAPYLFYSNARRGNAINKSSDSYLKRNSLGMEINSIDNKLHHLYASGGATNDAATTNLGYLDLREVFPILNVVQVLPVQIFRNLIVEIEFDATLANQILTDISGTITVQRPILAVDHIDNGVLVDQVINQLNGQGQLLCCKTAIDKTKELNANLVQGYGAVASSQVVCDAKTQYRLNGKNVLPGFGGITKDNERLGVLSDEWGSITCYPGSNIYQWATQGANMAVGVQFGGQMGWDCIRLGARVADLQINMSRTNNRDAGKGMTNAALQVNCYAEVMKQIVFSKGRYNITYA